jgi:hypothetical protein
MSVTRIDRQQSDNSGMKTRRPTLQSFWMLAGLCAFGAVGCANEVDDPGMPRAFKAPTPNKTVVTAPAGLPVNTAPGTVMVDLVQAARVVPPRPDPFSLQSPERLFETKQLNARIAYTVSPFFEPLFTPKPDAVQIEIQEPQPYRRLAGVLVGDSVMAIIDMGDGRPMEVIRPGMQIPNSPWRVISIDEEKAVLRRSGNKRPKEIVVRLETPAFGAGGPAIGGGFGGNANPGTGAGGAGTGAPPPGTGRPGGKGGGGGGID